MSSKLTYMALVILFLMAGLTAQKKVRVVTSGIQPATIKLGGNATVELTVKGTSEAELMPLPEVAGLRLRASGPSTRSFTTFNGFNRVSEVSVTFTVYIEPLRKGTYRLPPFRIKAGGQVWATGKDRLEVLEDFLGRQFGYLEVKASHQIAWVNEPVRITAIFGVTEEKVQENKVSGGLRLQLPWWDKLPGTVFLEGEKIKGQVLGVIVNEEQVQARTLGVESRNGKRYYLFSVSRICLPTETGELRVGAGSLFFKLATRVGRDFFGNPVPTGLEPCTVPGAEFKFEVRPFPEEGRPDDYTGAVGRFKVQARARPKDVQVGESVKVTMQISGAGNMGFFSAPEIKELDGFRSYGKTEERKGGILHVTYDLAPIREDVHRIPAISFSYFDTTPGEEGYKTLRTKPLRIRVRPLPAGQGLKTLVDKKPRVTPGVDDILDLKLGDWSVAPTRPDDFDILFAAIGLGAPPLLWLGLLVWWRSRCRTLADPRGRRRRVAHGRLKQALARADDVPSLGRAYEEFLADLWGLSPAAVQGGGWQDVAARQLAEATVTKMQLLLANLDRARFSPVGTVDRDTLEGEILALARDLDREVGK